MIEKTFSSKPVAIYNRRTLKLLELEFETSLFIKCEKSLSCENVRDHILTFSTGHQPSLVAHISILNLCNILDHLLLLVRTTSSDAHTYTYFLVKYSSILNQFREPLNVLLVEPSSADKVSLPNLCVCSNYNQILITLSDRFYLYDYALNTVKFLQSPIPKAHLIDVANCPLIGQFILLFSNLDVFFLGARSSDEALNHTLLSQNESQEIDPTVSITNEIFIQYPNVGVPNFTHHYQEPETLFALAFNKYHSGQKDLAISLTSQNIDIQVIAQNASTLSDRIIYSQSFLNSLEPCSTARKIKKIVEINENLVCFLRDIGILSDKPVLSTTQSNIVSHSCLELHKTVLHILRNGEKAKLCLLVHNRCDSPVLVTSLQKVGIESSENVNSFSLNELFIQILSNIKHLVQSHTRESIYAGLTSVNDFLLSCVDVFGSTEFTLKSLINSGFSCSPFKSSEFSPVDFSALFDSTLNQNILSYLLLMVDTCNSLSLDHEKLSLHLFCKKLLSLCKRFDELINNKFGNIYKNYIDSIFKQLEESNYVDTALDLALSLPIFEHVVGLCIRHNRAELLERCKLKWHHQGFDKVMNNWLTINKKWDLLTKEVDRSNISTICSQLPQLSWVYHIKQGNSKMARTALKEVARSENNLFFLKTYCSLYRLLEIFDDQPIDLELNYFASQIDYQLNTEKVT